MFLFFATPKLIAQVPEIITKTDYTVAGSETLIASQSITLKPNTWIKSGSAFLAKISPDAYLPFTFSNENYIFSRVFQSALTTSASIANNSDVIESIVYYDGLGRPMQNIAIKGSPSKQDIVTHISYDNFGRQDKEYLPYMDTSSSYGTYRSTAELNTNNYYKSNYNTDIDAINPNPFSQKEFENSPLSRVFKQGAPGKDWSINSGHDIKLDYLFNDNADGVKLYAVTTQLSVDEIYEPSVFSYSIYGENELYKTVVKNENWVSGKNNTTEEFKDKTGKIILKRIYTNYENLNQFEVKHDTYYVYDNYGNLTYVLPPKAEGVVSDAILKDICYQYKYDRRNRLVEKKLPGKDWEYIVYDKQDRPVLTQDVNLRASSKWMFTKYDAFSRPVYTGEYVNTVQTARASVQALANGSAFLLENKQTSPLNINGTNVNYSNNAFPNAGIDLFTINYYDDYLNIDLDQGLTAVSYGITPITNPKGLNTCSKVRILDTTNWTTTVSYYDAKGRPIYNYSKNNYLNTVATLKAQLDFVGKTLETTSSHTRASVTTSIVDAFTYDNSGRLLTQKQKINSQLEEIIVENTYDGLGQLTSKGVGGETTQSRLQNVDYTYNIRGWLKGINDVNAIGTDLFSFKINYNNPSTGTGLYNGNISQTFWKTQNQDPSLKNYTYSYDALNRLTNAVDNLARYNESLSYDKNGNITTLLRNGYTDGNATQLGTMDNLTYGYDAGNKLFSVEDSSNSTEGFKDGIHTPQEYTYDLNGNMKTDTNKGITTDIAYNHLNLPIKIIFATGNIQYVYDASGVKQEKKVVESGKPDVYTKYAGSFIYEKIGTTGADVLKFFSQPEGYVANNSGIFSYIYQYKDHLGNVRLSYGDNDNNGTVNSAEIIEENNYYPFGLKHKGYNYATVYGKGNAQAEKYKYNGKELQDELGLNLYDLGARNYDATLGKFMNIDPKAEQYSFQSTYAFANNNPILFVDINGEGVDGDYFDANGNYMGSDKIDDKKIYVVNNSNSPLNTGQTNAFNPPANFYDKDGIVNREVGQKNSTEITKLPFESRYKAATGILNYYYTVAGYNLNELKAKSITQMPSDISAMAITRFGGVTPNSEHLKPGEKDISVEMGHLGFDVNTGFDVMNLFSHERGQHMNDLIKFGKKIYDLPFEQRAYMHQFQDKTWKKVSPEFRTHIQSVAPAYVHKLDYTKYFKN